MATVIDDDSPFVPVVLTEKQANALVNAARGVVLGASVLAKTDEEREAIKSLAGGMMRLAKAVDTAREKRG